MDAIWPWITWKIEDITLKNLLELVKDVKKNKNYSEMYCKKIKLYLEKKQKIMKYKDGLFSTMLFSTVCFFSVGRAFDSGAAWPLYTHLWSEAEGRRGEEGTKSKALRAGCLSGADKAFNLKTASLNYANNDWKNLKCHLGCLASIL